MLRLNSGHVILQSHVFRLRLPNGRSLVPAMRNGMRFSDLLVALQLAATAHPSAIFDSVPASQDSNREDEIDQEAESWSLFWTPLPSTVCTSGGSMISLERMIELTVLHWATSLTCVRSIENVFSSPESAAPALLLSEHGGETMSFWGRTVILVRKVATLSR